MICSNFATVVTLSMLPLICHADDAPAPDAGRALYQSVCSACHGPENVMVSAPKAGDVVEWSKRLSRGSRGLETLTDNAINGFAAMPPKGGRNELSRDQIRQVIRFMMMDRKSTERSDPR